MGSNGCIFLLLIPIISGCVATGPVQEIALPFQVPEHFDALSSRLDPVPLNWVETFEDPQLLQLVAEVEAQNYTLQMAAAKVAAAAAYAQQAGAALGPRLNFGVQSEHQGAYSGANSAKSRSLGASIDVAWELDIWGRVRAESDAASKDFLATELDYHAAEISLAAQTTKAYFLAIKTGLLLDSARATLVSYQETMQVVQVFFDTGMVGIQAVHLAQLQAVNAEAALARVRASNLQALRGLEELLGRYPSAEVDVARQLPVIPVAVSAGLPSEVLERRPDILAAEMRLAAAFDFVQSAERAQLPRFSLTGSTGGVGDGLSSIVNPSHLVWNAVTNVMFPLFDAGQLEAQLAVASANQKAALANYQKVALRAFNEIEAALSNEMGLREQINYYRLAQMEADHAEQIGVETYKSGQGNLLDLQQLQRQALGSKLALIEAQHALLVQRVNLFLGLGGAF